jgi:uncharacterized membrane protein
MEGNRHKRWQSLPAWLRYTVIGLIVIGVFFRFFNLDRKIYWLDETYTSLRMSGYTRTEFVQNVTGKIVDVGTLEQYQHLNTERELDDTFAGLAQEEPQLTPLYFALTRIWLEWFGDSIAVTRSVSAILSLFAFPCLWWLCLELFRSPVTAWVAIALFAISPLQVLYAQEARPYSLWMVTALLSSAALLWAMRTTHRLRWSLFRWSLYGVTVSLGLYTHLLFGLVAIAHGIYVLSMQRGTVKRVISRTSLAYILATLAACFTLLPWMAVLVTHFEQAEASTASLREPTSFAFLINQWLVNNSRVFIGWDLGPVNVITAAGIGYALYFLYRTTSKRTWLFLFLLIAIPFLGLAIPDIVLEGERSTRIRYLMPVYAAIQIALAHLFATQAIWIKTKRQRWCRIAFIAVVFVNIIACSVSAQAQVWWTKSVPRSSYYPAVAQIINQAKNPLVISDGSPMEVLAFSRWLDSDTRLELLTQPKRTAIANESQPIFLLNPSKRLQAALTRQNYRLKLVYNDPHAPEEVEDRLWLVKKKLQ